MMLGRRPQEDFEAEIRAHLELEVDRLRGLGMSAEEAKRAARRNFGNTEIAGDRFHDAQRLAWLHNAFRDARHAMRSLLRSPGFTATSVGTLALALGAVAGMFNVVDTVLLEPLPFENPERLVLVQGTAPGSDLPEEFDLGPDFYLHFKEQSKLLENVFIYVGGTSTFRTDDRVERIRMSWPTNDIYATLGVRPQLGRLPVSADNDDAILISDRLWATWFGRDPSVIGKWYFVSDSMKQVIGVMPAEFSFPTDETMLWVSQEFRRGEVEPGDLGGNVVARMKENVTPEQLAAELTRISKGMPESFGGSASYSKLISQYNALVFRLHDRMVGPSVKTSLWVLLGGVSIVLLIACANIANLFMVRAEGRKRDSTVRRAIGASRLQLVRYQLMEAVVVAGIAGVHAMALSAVTLPLFLQAAPEGIPRLAEVGLDLKTMGAAFVMVLLVGVACGTAPALRSSSPDLTALRDGGRGTTGRRAWGRDALVAAQTALALVLLIGSALLIQSFQKLRNVEPGYDIENIYTFQYATNQPRFHDGPTVGRMHVDFMERLRALPGTLDVGVVNNLPLAEGTGGMGVRSDLMPADATPLQMSYNFAGGDYFRALHIPVLAGRIFTDDEAMSLNNSVIVSRSAAEKLWPGLNALGRSLSPQWGDDADTTRYTVVGIVDDVKQNDWREPGEEAVYFALTGPSADVWAMGSPAYVVKSARADELTREIRAMIREFAPEAPVYAEFTMETLAQRSMTELSFTMLTLGVVSALALVLGVVGLYGVLSYVVAQRTREIGVRMALGATKSAVRRQIVSQGTRVVVVGVILGVVGALASTRVLGTLLYGVTAVDPRVFAAMSVIMIGMGMLASYMPARRASRLDPIVALRND